MFCSLYMYHANSITSKDICSITYVDYVQTYQLTIAGEYNMFGNCGGWGVKSKYLYNTILCFIDIIRIINSRIYNIQSFSPRLYNYSRKNITS